MANPKKGSENKEYGRFLQFWLTDLNLMQLQHHAGTAVQANNFEVHVDA